VSAPRGTDWAPLLAEARAAAQDAGAGGASIVPRLRAAGAVLARHGLDLSFGRTDEAARTIRFDLLALGGRSLGEIERRVGAVGLVTRAAAFPISATVALERAVTQRQGAYYPDVTAFIGPALSRHALLGLARRVAARLALGGAVVCPLPPRGIICVSGAGVDEELVRPLEGWALDLGTISDSALGQRVDGRPREDL
jgi:hypothetical protein